MSPDELSYLFHHLFLPSKLPGDCDTSGGNESCLLNLVEEALNSFINHINENDHDAIKSAIAMIGNAQNARDPNGNLQEFGVLKALDSVVGSSEFALLWSLIYHYSNPLQNRLPLSIS